MAREYIPYQAHILRKGVVHTSDDETVTLLGDLATEPETEVKYVLEFPSLLSPEPSVNLRFIPKDQIDTYIEDCKKASLEIPPNFDTYPSPDLSIKREVLKVRLTDDRPGRFKLRFQESLGISKRRVLLEMEQMEINFITEPEEGAYVFLVEFEPQRDDVSPWYSVVVYNKEKTFFPQSEEDDLADLSKCLANISCKNGILWFVQPFYVIEQYGNVTLSDEVKQEMIDCEGLPEDLPADDDTVVGLQRGYAFRGLKKVWIDVDKEEKDVCVQTDTIQVIKDDQKFEFSEFMKKL